LDIKGKSPNPICVKEAIYELEDLPYEQINKELYYNNVQLIGNIDEVLAYDKYARITILEVYPGDKYQDTAISEMVFFESEYTWNPYTFKEGYILSDQPIIKVDDQEKNYTAGIEKSKTKTREIHNKEGLENRIKTNEMRCSKKRIENRQNQNDEKKQIDIKIIMACSILSITLIGLIIYLVKKKQS
jgi:hypothetical protein